MAAPAQTHTIEFDDDRVTKRFRSADNGEPHREWRTLHLLSRRAPGLAATPLTADLDSPSPSVTMSRLNAESLGGEPLTTEQIRAVAEALDRLHYAATTEDLRELPIRIWQPQAALSSIRAWAAEGPALGADARVHQAFAAGVRWLHDPETDELARADVPPVLGLADGNLANLLWDGERVRLVDFEDSGVSDRAYEIADLTEHVSTWVDGALDRDALIAALGLSPDEHIRYARLRPLWAMFWLLMLLPDGPANGRNPAGTLERQAQRLLDLLD